MKTILSSVEPMTDSELNEMKEKDHQRWLDRTLDELVNCARTDKEFAKKLCKKITELSYGKRELSKILKSKAISGSGRYPPFQYIGIICWSSTML